MGCYWNGGSNGDEVHTDVGQTHGSNISSDSIKQFMGKEFDIADGLNKEDNEKTNVTENSDSSEKSDMGLTLKADYQIAMPFEQSVISGISQLNDPSVGSPNSRGGSGQCVTAPSGVQQSLFLEKDELSGIDKKNLTANLVNIQNDGTVEVDLTKNEPADSDLLQGSLCATDSIATKLNMSVPKLKIAMLVVGTRGDIQPFLAIAKRLQEFGHHVRLATHMHFSSFVKSAGVEFYPLAGDPKVLAGYVSRNKGLFPKSPREISINRKQIKSIIESVFPACTAPDLESGQPFKAQAIIANPPAYGHIHVAEALAVPIHILFTLPWTPTYEFPHPLARVPQTAAYWLSYVFVDLFIWWAIGGYINDYRKKKLNLPPIANFSLYNGSTTHLPTAYMWSPHLVPKPGDWGPLVDVVGYCFLNLGSKYQPPNNFVQWIQKGPKPIYISFGSMLLEDPKKTTNIILEALQNTGQRGIIGQGWGDLGTVAESSKDVYLLADCPHDWLFPQCLAVVHHGGAGTTAAGLRAGLPTTIVPFFGDQYFWGEQIQERGLGPSPIPITKLTVEALSDAITFMLQPEIKTRALKIAKHLENEDGVAGVVDAFHRHLPSELPLPKSMSQEHYHPSPLQWLFAQIGGICCLPCGRL